MNRKNFVIAIDGPAGSGKSTTAKKVAQSLNFFYLDSGAMYRAVTLLALQKHVRMQDERALLVVAKEAAITFDSTKNFYSIYLNGQDVTLAVREPRVTDVISYVASNPHIRKILVPKQREFSRYHNLVAEGRDIGTVVFPDADLKIFMVADLKTRARRRYDEFLNKGIQADFKDIIKAIEIRDKNDSERRYSPLQKAPDAFELDTSAMSIDEQVVFVVEKARERGA
ncbi:(d)CMP kinase [candidate division KSB1 bacterium]|nr:(d)CMP kinase [candidate division KSB1 bacterium]